MSEPFDFDAFIKGTQLPRRTVTVYRVDHRDEIARLTREHDAIRDEGADEREGSVSVDRRAEIAEQVATLRAEMEAGRADFVIRTLTPDEFARVRDDDDLDVYDQIEMQSVEPHLNHEQWEQVANAIGAGQWGALVAEANDLILKRVAVPDFSRTVSATLSRRVSSES